MVNTLDKNEKEKILHTENYDSIISEIDAHIR